MNSHKEIGDFEALQHVSGEEISKIISRINYDPHLKEIWINVFFSLGQYTSIVLSENDRQRFVQCIKDFIKISQESKSNKMQLDNHVIGYVDCDISSIGKVQINDISTNKVVVNCDYRSSDNTYSELMIVTSHVASAYISVLIIDRPNASKLIAILDNFSLN